tara:strand:+ start:82 stop:831 length:750 start_codon:yes stop_codon:yes gene_type:complete
MRKFHTVEVKPTIAAAKQHLGAFADNDVVFDWTPFYIPNGASRLISASLILRGTDGASQSAAFDIFFAKSFSSSDSGVNFEAPGSLGTIHATANGTGYFKNMLGYTRLEENDQASGLDTITVIRNAHDRGRFIDMTLDPEPHSGDVKGFGVLYVGGITVDGDLNFASTLAIDGNQAGGLSSLTVKTIAAINVFDKGDVLHDEGGLLLGTAKSIDSPTSISIVSGLSNAAVNNRSVYCTTPITLRLSFEV